jgi:hypothetical protein
MISLSGSRARNRSLSLLSLLVGCLSLLVAGCGGGGNSGGGTCSGASCPVQSYTITVNSTNPATGVVISYGSALNSLSTTGTTAFTLTEPTGSTFIFSAPATAGGNNFSSWSGCTSATGATCTVTVSGNIAITANYVTPAVPVAPTVTVTPGSGTITTGQSLSAVVTVAAPSGGTAGTPTGTVVLTSGSYTSAAAALSGGSATITVPAGSLAAGTDSLKATYTPDTAGAVNYASASGTATVTVNPPPVPTISVNLSATSLEVSTMLTATVTVSGASGSAMPTGTIAVSGGGLSAAISGTLSNGSVVLSIPANSLTVGSDTLTFTYTPDTAGAANYSSGTKTAAVTVTATTYTLTVDTNNPASGVSIGASPADNNKSTGGASPLTLTYNTGAAVTLTAPATAGGGTFDAWSGCTSTSGVTCNVTLNANTTVTAAYSSLAVSPASPTVTIGNSQQFTATGTNLSSAVTWSVAVASGTGSAGTISTSGLYQSPYPAPTTVTVTATSTSNSAIKATATVTLTVPATAAGPALTVDAKASDGNPSNPNCASGSPCPINPLIYGMNAYLLDPTTATKANITVARWGGDDTSRYNYQTNVVNSANDYYFENFTGSNSMLPNGATGNGTNFNDYLAETTTLGISSIATAPVIGWVSNSSLHSSTATGCSFPMTGLNGQASYPNQQSYNGDNCGNGVESNGTTDLTGNNTVASFTSILTPPPAAPTPASGATLTWAQTTWTGGWVNCLLTGSTNGTPYCTGAGGKDATIWDMDNEPEYWSAVHRDVHPNPMTYDEITNGGIGTALAIKTVDNNAQISGPVISGWYQYFYSQQDVNNGYGHGPCYQPWEDPTDREAHNGTPLIEYYIQQMASASDTYNLRLLDYVDLHAYYAGYYNGASVGFQTAGDTAEQQVRMNSVRAFWDPTYTDPNNNGLYKPVYPPDPNQTAASCKTAASPDIIPMMQTWASADWKSNNFPARLKTSIDEYNFGGMESINGAVTQADVLGVFGKYGLDMGVFWPTSGYSGQVPASMAFEIYRNYDGNKSTFGDESLNANSTNQGQLSVYAAARSADGSVTVVVINKTYGPLTSTISVSNLTGSPASAAVFQYSNANLNAITAQGGATITPPASGSTASTISYTFPAQSITLFVIP